MTCKDCICNQFENKSEYIKLPQIDKQDYIDVVKSISKVMVDLVERLIEND